MKVPVACDEWCQHIFGASGMSYIGGVPVPLKLTSPVFVFNDMVDDLVQDPLVPFPVTL